MTADAPGLPLERVTRWLRRELPELTADGAPEVELLAGGLSNLTYRLRFRGGSVILRRPPLGEALPSAHDMAREFRVLRALVETRIPVPTPLAFCADPAVIGRPFYLMTDVAGRVFRTPGDTAALSPHSRLRVAEILVDTLVDLHAVDVEAIGLAGYGRPEGYCARQIRRWADQWRRSQTTELPAMHALFQRLAAQVPEPPAVALVHGDYRLENTILEADHGEPRIAAVVDWELSTLGDPLVDLGMLLTYWHDVDDDERALIHVGAGLTNKPGFLATHEISARYAALTGVDLSELAFYRAFATMKLAVILEGIHARFVAGHTVARGSEAVGRAVPVLVQRALRMLCT